MPPDGFAAALPSRGKDVSATLDIPLGPEIGQCCGGRVE
ncbi:MAG: xanthine dehydrogenase accessory protein XdhC, partial [Mesorhizobium sp.]